VVPPAVIVVSSDSETDDNITIVSIASSRQLRSPDPVQDLSTDSWFGFVKPDVPQNSSAPIYLDPRDNPSRTPSLAPGDQLPPVPIRRGGKRQASKKPLSKRFVQKKTHKYDRVVKALVADQRENPQSHPRPYVVGERWAIARVPPPTLLDVRRSDRKRVPGSVILSTTEVPLNFAPQNTTLTNPPAEEIVKHFRQAKTLGLHQ